MGTGAAVFIPSWKLGWDGVALIQTRSLAWFEGGNIPTFQIKYDTNIYSQTYKNRSTFKTRQRDAQCDLESALWKTWNEANSAEETWKILELAMLELIQTSWKATKPLRGASDPGLPGLQHRAGHEELQVFSIFFFFLRNKQTLPGEKKRKRRRRRQEELAGGGLSSVAAAVAAGTGPGLRVWLLVMRFHIHPGNG